MTPISRPIWNWAILIKFYKVMSLIAQYWLSLAALHIETTPVSSCTSSPCCGSLPHDYQAGILILNFNLQFSGWFGRNGIIQSWYWWKCNKVSCFPVDSQESAVSPQHLSPLQGHYKIKHSLLATRQWILYLVISVAKRVSWSHFLQTSSLSYSLSLQTGHTSPLLLLNPIFT